MWNVLFAQRITMAQTRPLAPLGPPSNALPSSLCIDNHVSGSLPHVTIFFYFFNMPNERLPIYYFKNDFYGILTVF